MSGSEIKQITFNFLNLPESETTTTTPRSKFKAERDKGQENAIIRQTLVHKQEDQEEESELNPERILFKEKCEYFLMPIFEKIRQNYIKDLKAQITMEVGDLFGCDYFEITIEWDFKKENYYSEIRSKRVGLIVLRDIFDSYKSDPKSKFESRGSKTWDLTPAATHEKNCYIYLIKELSKMKRTDAQTSCWDLENCVTLNDSNLKEKVLRAIKKQLKHPEEN